MIDVTVAARSRARIIAGEVDVQDEVAWLAHRRGAVRARNPESRTRNQPLEARALGSVALRIDGDLRDWRGVRFASLGEEDSGSMQYALATDAEALYVGARVSDDDVVRSAEASTDEDAVVLTLALPGPDGRFVAHEVWLYPGSRANKPRSARFEAGARIRSR